MDTPFVLVEWLLVVVMENLNEIKFISELRTWRLTMSVVHPDIQLWELGLGKIHMVMSYENKKIILLWL